MKIDLKKISAKYARRFSKNRLFSLLLNRASFLGTKVIYTTLLLFYAYKRNETPSWAKNIIIGALGYLISPIDALPDLTPVIGYTDDIGVLSFGLVTIASYINIDIKDKAKARLDSWFPQWNQASIIEIDEKL